MSRTTYIVYDFAQTPRKLGSLIIENAAYNQKMVADRWYLCDNWID